MSFDGTIGETDEALLERFAAGDHSAARQLTQRLAPRTLTLASRLLGDHSEAEDVTQEAMLRLWRIAPDWRIGEAKVTTWLHKVTTNLCIDRLRKRRRTGPPLDEVAEPSDPAPGAEARLAAADQAAMLRSALQRLPERQRLAIAMRHFEDMSNPDIGAALDVSVEAVESLLARGRRTLKAAVNAVEAQDDKS